LVSLASLMAMIGCPSSGWISGRPGSRKGVEIVGDQRGSKIAMAVIQIGQDASLLLGRLVFWGVVESGGGWQAVF
jgi:hypothetical protein